MFSRVVAATTMRRALVSTCRRVIIPTTTTTTSVRTFSAEPSLIPGVGKGKTSTGLVGLPVDHDAIPKIISKYQALLDRMAESDMPEDAHYRTIVEKVCRYRIQAARDHPDDPEKVEELCNCGQVEELVEQAEHEMIVLDMYLRERWWEKINLNPITETEPDMENESEGVDWTANDEKNAYFKQKYYDMKKAKEEAEAGASKEE